MAIIFIEGILAQIENKDFVSTSIEDVKWYLNIVLTYITTRTLPEDELSRCKKAIRKCLDVLFDNL